MKYLIILLITTSCTSTQYLDRCNKYNLQIQEYEVTNKGEKTTFYVKCKEK